MQWFEALILGLIQGLTEFLPVSSSGHLELGRHLLGVETTENLRFTVVVHGATVLSTLVVFRRDIAQLLIGLFQFKWNDETKYISKIILSMVPIAVVGLFFKDYVEELFDSENILLIVGLMLLVTALLLGFSYFRKTGHRNIGYGDAFIIGLAQTIAVVPGISRSGSTIATGLLLGNKRSEVARFSFLMVLIPIIGENILSLIKTDVPAVQMGGHIDTGVLFIGFLAAFVSGLLACKWMIDIVKRGKLIYFAIYCAIVGTMAIVGAL
jgi:undecaprenyl-diphosphatase